MPQQIELAEAQTVQQADDRIGKAGDAVAAVAVRGRTEARQVQRDHIVAGCEAFNLGLPLSGPA